MCIDAQNEKASCDIYVLCRNKFQANSPFGFLEMIKLILLIIRECIQCSQAQPTRLLAVQFRLARLKISQLQRLAATTINYFNALIRISFQGFFSLLNSNSVNSLLIG